MFAQTSAVKLDFVRFNRGRVNALRGSQTGIFRFFRKLYYLSIGWHMLMCVVCALTNRTPTTGAHFGTKSEIWKSLIKYELDYKKTPNVCVRYVHVSAATAAAARNGDENKPSNINKIIYD